MELADGYKREYRSDGTGKSLGIKVSVEYPRSWHADEGRRPHILQKFQSPDNLASAMIYIKEVPLLSRLSSDRDNLDYLSSKDFIEKETPGVTFLSNGKTTIAGKRAAFCDAMLSRSAPAGDVTVRNRMYFIIHKGKVITVTFDVAAAGLNSKQEMTARFQKFQKLFELMATGVDFFDKYQ